MRNHSLPGTNKKDYISSAEWQDLEQAGKLQPKVIGIITCYFCDTTITQQDTDARGIPLPKCTKCDVYYEFQWILQDGIIGIKTIPRTYHNQQTEPNAIKHPPEQEHTPQTADTKAPQHKDVKGQIIALMAQKQTPIKTKELLNNINASRQSIMTQINQLIAHGKIRKVQRATYQLIPQQNNPNVN